jgi:hypothetical protein
MKTMNDLPDILNSINWQLKRIADHLDKQNQKEVEPQNKTSQRTAKDILADIINDRD